MSAERQARGPLVDIVCSVVVFSSVVKTFFMTPAAKELLSKILELNSNSPKN
jgi:NhaP-type Na+/H+ or K+/H+ antiporter